METNANENTIVQNLWDAAKVVLKEQFIQYRPTSRSMKNLKQPKGARKRTNYRSKEIIKIRAEINKIETLKK